MHRKIGGDSPESPVSGRSFRRRWGAACVALYDLARDNDDTTAVFRIVDALRGDGLQRLTNEIRQSASGRGVLARRQSLLSILSDREHLATLPAGSLGAEYLNFMTIEGLTAEGLAEASASGYASQPSDEEERFVEELVRDSHDLWHVLTGYGRDPLGELCLLGVLYQQANVLGAAFIALLGVFQVTFEYPGAPAFRAVREGFRIGRQANWLVAEDWASHLATPIDEVRATLGIRTPEFYLKSLPLHDRARSHSRAMRANAL